jgi:hypothetical protein
LTLSQSVVEEYRTGKPESVGMNAIFTANGWANAAHFRVSRSNPDQPMFELDQTRIDLRCPRNVNCLYTPLGSDFPLFFQTFVDAVTSCCGAFLDLIVALLPAAWLRPGSNGGRKIGQGLNA